MSRSFEELETLLMDWESNSLDDEGVRRLREILASDADARTYFVRLQMINAAMQQESDAGIEPPSSYDDTGTTLPAPTQLPSRESWWLVAALSLMVCLLGGWILYSEIAGNLSVAEERDRTNGPGVTDGPRSDRRVKEATAEGVALVTRLIDVHWSAKQTPVEVGAALPPGRFAVDSGVVQLEFFCGATVILEGPAELDLHSSVLAEVHRGQLRAQVPPAARGFTLKAVDLTVVDLGTEFGMSVSEGSANVQVFDGEVEFHAGAQKKRSLKKGQGVTRTASGEIERSQVDPGDFVDIADVSRRAAVQQSARFDRWQKRSQQLRDDPRVIAYYAFDQQGPWRRRLASSVRPANSELDGAIVGAREVAGRWPVKQSLEFKQPADRVRVQIPGEFGSLTFACWTKIDSLDRWYNSLFLTDGYDKGEPHWQILDSGQIYFSIRPLERGRAGPRDFKALSPTFWSPSLQGKWIHLAVTCDLDARLITHYVNGEVLSRHAVPDEQMPDATRIGDASIGNWSLPTMPDARFAIRNLNGSIDEFAILSVALTADEIKEMYQYGSP